MDGELTDYKYDQEAEMIAAHQEDFDAGRVHFAFDELKARWRKVATP
jgi:hypothetical protein